VAFSGNSDVAPASGFSKFTEQASDLLRSQPTLPRAVATGIGILLLGLFVLRPLTKQTQQLLKAPVQPALLTAGSQASAPVVNAEQAQQDLVTAGPPIHGAPMNTQHIFDRVTEHIRSEPHGSTRLIGSWIGAGTEEGE
jgi:flagellar M-ring protein FliF